MLGDLLNVVFLKSVSKQESANIGWADSNDMKMGIDIGTESLRKMPDTVTTTSPNCCDIKEERKLLLFPDSR